MTKRDQPASTQHEQVLYFAYGSNMSSKRLQARVPSASFYARARLRGHQLRFHKHSTVDNSAKCDAFKTDEADDVTHGILFLFNADEQAKLDSCEGAGYQITQVEVELEDGKRVTALTYLAIHIEPRLRPYPWYKRHVLEGAREHALPAEYIAWIEAVETQEDPNQQRSQDELTIHH
ncbi:gamma-glutamylcyclotransferase family protein [Methylophaga sp. OBS1]|uniref:gamma-glutamylcyclotransferase family protein n=1 Tax=Methylophaga sp. OBS1 TaxID=2991933 RepID=UPI00224FDFFF|nr:gamma-glutamylcyclotransferase family protein [Methylophaga sp. OBS1]MCX4191061.1 gamma-glutamylcyclotransferase [Methylophaga sp. OBS1]MCX4191993.1 gamma-glutamylcyclotransferase [Methylophaga sp. OBS1]